MVELYSADQCIWSGKMKAHLDAAGIEYRSINVAEPVNAEKLYSLTGQRGFPVTVIGDEIIIGCDTKAVDKAIQNMR
ncbi:MAG: hypothetical protein J6Y64_03340 [Ruminococcus sp.]|nr:hypothetical protein [Ruminococcus sp.]